jgi:hypothetical protein
LVANQALSLRAQKTERNTPLEGESEEAVLHYKVSRLKWENVKLGKEICLLRKMMEEMRRVSLPSPEKKSPEERRRKEKKKKCRERRRVMRFSSSSPDISPMRFFLHKKVDGVAYRDDEHPVLRPVIMGVRRRLDIEKPPSETPAPTVVLPLQPQESTEAIVERVLG